MVLMFVFATFGVHLLGGKLWRCNDPEIGKDKVFYSDNKRIYDGVEAETRKSQASFQIIQVSSEALPRMRLE